LYAVSPLKTWLRLICGTLISDSTRRRKLKNLLFTIFLIAVLPVISAGCTPGTVVHVNPSVSNGASATPQPSGQINVPGLSINIWAPGPNPLVNTADAHGAPAGILLGIWQGFISPITMVLSFFNQDVNMYEVHNDGGQYNLGFLAGVALMFVLLSLLVRR
jgi:hypothetical protein